MLDTTNSLLLDFLQPDMFGITTFSICTRFYCNITLSQASFGGPALMHPIFTVDTQNKLKENTRKYSTHKLQSAARICSCSAISIVSACTLRTTYLGKPSLFFCFGCFSCLTACPSTSACPSIGYHDPCSRDRRRFAGDRRAAPDAPESADDVCAKSWYRPESPGRWK
jgi:hypothetical protein